MDRPRGHEGSVNEKDENLPPMLEYLLQADRALTLWLNGSDSLFLDRVAWTATSTVVWMPMALVLLYVVIRNNELPGVFLTVLSVACCILVADQVASSVFKPLVARYRPSQDPELMGLIDTVNGYRGGLYGFFSSHAANTFAVAVFVSLLLRRRGLSAVLCGWALFNCWTRVYLGVHYVGDLLCGALFGALTGWAVFCAYRRVAERVRALPRRTERSRPGWRPWPEGDACLLASAFMLTCVGIFFYALIVCDP